MPWRQAKRRAGARCDCVRLQPRSGAVSNRGVANTRVNDLGTDDLPWRRTPFDSQSKSFRPNCLLAPFLKSTVRETAANRFVACMMPTIFPRSGSRPPSSNAHTHPQYARCLPSSIRAEGRRSNIATKRVLGNDRRAGDRGIVVSTRASCRQLRIVTRRCLPVAKP